MSGKASSSKRASERLGIVSPHLDDAAFACGELIAARPGATVVTIFTGRPPAGLPLAAWDAEAGFEPGDDVIAARRAEDRRALGVLGARPRWLEFRDSQYGPSASMTAVAAALAGAIARARATTVLIPLGLFHSDHHLAHDAALAVLARRGDVRWIAYEDAMYRRLPGLLDERLERLRAAGLAPRRFRPAVPRRTALKRRAIAAYRSQLRALTTPGRPGWADALEREGYWTLAA